MRGLRKVLSNVGVFVLVAGLVYLAGTALLGAWPMWSAMMNGTMMGDGMMDNGMMGGSGLLGALLMLLFWGGVLGLIAWLLISVFSSLFSGGREEEAPDVSPDTAEATLRERFARGEINTEEYQRSLRTLREETQHEDRENLLRSGRE